MSTVAENDGRTSMKDMPVTFETIPPTVVPPTMNTNEVANTTRDTMIDPIDEVFSFWTKALPPNLSLLIE